MNKRILLLAPIFHPLHDQIIKELGILGFEVGFIPDIVQRRFNPYTIDNPCKSLKKIIYKFYNTNLKYHQKNITIWNQKWDYFLCINGWSIEPELLSILKSKNKEIKTFLYLWDSTKLYDFQRIFNYFDNIYTFDPEDAKTYNITYLPLFWTENNTYNIIKTKIEYDISFIGKLHGDRYEYLKLIEKECINNNLSYFFRIVYHPVSNYMLIKLFSKFIKRFRIAKKNADIIKYCHEDDILTSNYLPFDKVTDVIQKSKCVLDNALEGQHGLTHRMIISLANKRKIITTNKWVKDDILFSKNRNIMVINIDNPRLDLNFIEQKFVEDETSNMIIKNLRIDNWLKTILRL